MLRYVTLRYASSPSSTHVASLVSHSPCQNEKNDLVRELSNGVVVVPRVWEGVVGVFHFGMPPLEVLAGG